MLTKRIVELACQSFGSDYEENSRRAVARLQALLRSEEACAARIALLAELAEGQDLSAPSISVDADRWDENGRAARVADAIRDRYLRRGLESGDIAPEEVDALLRDPEAIRVLHLGVTYQAPSQTVVLVEKGWGAVAPIFPRFLDVLQDLAGVRGRDRQAFRDSVTRAMESIHWRGEQRRFRDLLTVAANDWLTAHRYRRIARLDWNEFAMEVAFLGGMSALAANRKADPEVVASIRSTIRREVASDLRSKPASIARLMTWIESIGSSTENLRKSFRLSPRHSLADAHEVCQDLIREFRRNLAGASDALDLTLMA